MPNIDERVVEMRFDNKDFEKNVQTSLNTIDKLKKGLDFKDSTKSLEDLQDAVKHFTLDDIGNALNELNSKVSSGGALALGVISEIGRALTDKILNVLNRIKGELHLEDLDGISNAIEGWNKYGQKTNSVATIMAATGESIEVVNDAMDKLLYFTDETSYKFTDMTDNVGKFTANGVGLTEAASAMEGIATWAARSGQNASTASRVMYNLSQAIGMGALKLQDWKSVELANMGTKEFKQVAINAGLASGTLIKVGDAIMTVNKKATVTTATFRESLKEGWLDTETLMATLTEYGKAAELINDINTETGLYASEMIELVELMKKGKYTTEDLKEALGGMNNPLTENAAYLARVEEMLEKLGSSEYAFSLETFKAAQEARTFGDAMAAVADAVSSSWMRTFEFIFGDYEKAKELWTDLANNLIEIFGAGAEARNSLLDAASSSGFDDLIKGVEATGVTLDEFDRALMTTTRISEGFDLTNLIDEYGSVTEAFRRGNFGDLSSDQVKDMVSEAIDNLHKLGEVSEETSEYIGLTYEELDKYGRDVRAGMYGWVGSEDQIHRLMQENSNLTREQAETIVEYAKASHELHRSLTEEEAQQYLQKTKGNTAQEESIELTEEEKEALKAYLDELDRQSARDNFIEGLINSGHIALGVFKAFRSAWEDMFPPTTPKRLSEMATRFKELTARVRDFFEGDNKTENINKLKEVFYKLLLPLRLVADIFGALTRLIIPLGKFIWALISPIASLVSGLFRLFSLVGEGARELDPFANTINKVTDAIIVFLNFVTEVAKYVGGIIKDKLIEKLAGPITKLAKQFKDFKTDKFKGLEGFVERIKALDPKVVGDKIIKFLSDLYHFIIALKNGDTSGLSEMFDGLIKRFGPISTFLSGITTKFDNFKKSVNLRSAILDESKFVSALNIIKFKASAAFENLKNKIFGTSEAGQALRAKFDALIASVAKLKDQVVSKFKEIKDAILNLLQGKEVDFGSIFGSFEEKKQAVLDFFNEKGITLPKILKGGALAIAAGGLLKFINTLREAKKDFTFGGFVESLNPFADSLDKVKTATSSFNILAFAIAMGVLAASLIALSAVDATSLGVSLGSLGITLAEFIGTLAAVNKVMGKKNILNFIGLGLGMMAIAKAMLIFAKAVNEFANIDFQSGSQALKTIALITLAVLSLGRLAKVAGKFKFKLSSGLGLIAAAASLWIFGKTLQSYSKLKINRNNILKVLTVLVLAVGTLGILAKIVGNSEFKLSNGLALMAMATSLLIFAGVVAIFGHMKKEVLTKGLIALAALAAIVTAMAALIGLIMRTSGIGAGIATVLTLASITGSLTILALVVAGLGLMPEDKISKGIDTLKILGKYLVIMDGVITLISRFTSIKQAISTLIILGGIVVSLTILAGLVVVLGTLALISLPGVVAVGLLMVGLIGMVKAITELGRVADLKAAFGVVGSLLLFVVALIGMTYVLKEVAQVDATAATEGLILIGGMLGAFIVVLGAATAVGYLASMAGPIFLVGIGVVAVLFTGFILAIHQAVTELERLSQLDSAGIMSAIDAIDALIDEFIGIADKFNENGITFGEALETSASMFVFGKGLYPLITDAELLGLVNATAVVPGIQAVDNLIDYMISLRDKFLQSGTNFGNALLVAGQVFAFGIGLYPLANDVQILGLANAQNAKDAMEPLEGLIALMITLAATVGSDPSMFRDALTVTGVMLAFGVALLPLVGAEFITGLSDAETVKSNMTMISDLIDQFFSIAEKVGSDATLYEAAEKVADAIKSFGDALVKIIASEFIAQFVDAKAAESGFAPAKDIINFFIEVAKKFSDGENGVSYEAAENAAKACKKFADVLVELVAASFISQFVNSEASKEGFEPVKDIVDFFIEVAKKFDGGEEGVSYDAAESAVKACKKFADVLIELIASTFISQFVNSEASKEGFEPVKDIVNFFIDTAKLFDSGENGVSFDAASQAAEACGTFGGALAKLIGAEWLSSLVNAEDSQASFNVVKQMAGMMLVIAHAFNNNEGLFESAKEAAEACSDFSVALKDLTKAEKKVQKVDAYDALAGLEAIQTTVNLLISLAKNFARTQGMKQAAEDAAASISVFTEKLRSMAIALSNTWDNEWKNVDPEKVKTIITTLVDMMTTLTGITNFGDVSAAVDSINGFFTALGGLKTQNGMFSETFDASSLTNTITEISTAISALSTSIGKLNSSNLSAFVSTLNDLITTEALDTTLTAMFTFGVNIIDNISSGIDSNGEKISISLSTISNKAIQTIIGYRSAFNSAGINVMVGFNNGMVSQAQTIYNNARTIANSVINILKGAFKIKSPSRVFAEIGEYAILGLAKGFEDTGSIALESIETLGDALVDTMQRAMTYVNTSDYGIAPSITPVLDMNTMTGQAASINSMINGFNFKGIAANANIDGATINNTIQSRDIINEIKQLNERMAIMDDNLQNLQVVLDTGVLVGQTSAKMDNQFGLMAMRKGRGN